MTTEFASTTIKDQVYFKGQLIAKKDALLSVFNPAAQFGLSVFEGIRYYRDFQKNHLLGFRVDSHFLRLKRSAAMLDMKFEMEFELFQSTITRVINANKINDDAVVRVILYPSGDGSWSYTGDSDLLISAMARGRVECNPLGGLACGISTWRRSDSTSLPPSIKMGANYINSRLGQLEAKAGGFDSAIFLNSRGTVAEAPGSCVAIVKDGRLILVPSYCSVLDSITIDTISQLARSIGVAVEQREFDRLELLSADEAMLVGTTMEIVPISSVDRKSLRFCPGPLTTKITEEYFAAVRGQKYLSRGWVSRPRELSQ